MGEKLNHMLKEIIFDQTDKKETTNKKLPVFEYRFHNYVITSDGHIFSQYNYKDMADNNGQVRLRIDGKLVSFSKKKLIYETCYNDFHMRYKEDFSGPVISYDEKIVFIDGSSILTKEKLKGYFVDDRHPNDLGMQYIATKILDCLK